MKGEIDGNFYCSAGAYTKPEGNCCFSNGCQIGMAFGRCRKNKCPYYHRKHPTPEQYREEYGDEWPDDGEVYFLERLGVTQYVSEWVVTAVNNLIGRHCAGIIVCACTPWGKPPDSWRPE